MLKYLSSKAYVEKPILASPATAIEPTKLRNVLFLVNRSEYLLAACCKCPKLKIRCTSIKVLFFKNRLRSCTFQEVFDVRLSCRERLLSLVSRRRLNLFEFIGLAGAKLSGFSLSCPDASFDESETACRFHRRFPKIRCRLSVKRLSARVRIFECATGLGLRARSF
jgi:hypothetical protein